MKPTSGSKRALARRLSLMFVGLFLLGQPVLAAEENLYEIPSPEAFAAALDKLNASYSESVDPEANSIVGRYFCFSEDDWEKGIPYLALGQDDDLRAAARLDLQLQSKPKKGPEMLRMGNCWAKLVAKALATDRKNPVKLSLQDRKRYWYEQALPYLSAEKKRQCSRRSASPCRIVTK